MVYFPAKEKKESKQTEASIILNHLKYEGAINKKIAQDLYGISSVCLNTFISRFKKNNPNSIDSYNTMIDGRLCKEHRLKVSM